MALLEEQFTEKLQAGAPDITYEGNEGQEQQVAQALWDKLPPQVRMQFGDFSQFFNTGAWKKVLQMIQERQGSEEIQETETVESAPQAGLGSMMPAPRPMAFGGIAGLDGRRAYGWGSKLKDFGKKLIGGVKKVVKSPIGKAALLAGGAGLLGGYGTAAKGFDRFGLGNIMTGAKNLWGGKILPPGVSNPSGLARSGGLSGLISKFPGGGWGAAGTAAALTPFAMQAMGKWDPGMDQFTREGGEFDFNYKNMRKDLAEALSAGDYEKWKTVLANYDLTEGTQVPFWDTLAHGAEGGRAMAQGGRIGYLAGGPLVKKGIDALRKFKRPIFSFDDETKMIMDLTETGKYTEKELMTLEGDQLVEIYVREGFTPPQAIPQVDETIEMKKITPEIEKAYGGRVAAQEGGFVPIGGKEKADDVPARLSRNEFVFTADAVRAAGGGDIDQGAEVMENVMKNLEGVGRISKESQGQGARDMFQVSERLSEVV